MHLYSQQPVRMTTSSYPRQRCEGRGDDSNSYSLEKPSEVFLRDDNVPSLHESQNEEDLLGAIIVIRPYRFEFSDGVSEALRSPVALEADKEEDRLPDSLSSSQVEAGVANITDAHQGK